MGTKKIVTGEEKIVNKIYMIRGMKVMLDFDLAELYKVETGQLNRHVRRNKDRFPDDFMFVLTAEEHDSLRCQIGILKRASILNTRQSHLQQVVARLSSVFNLRWQLQSTFKSSGCFPKCVS